MNTDSIYRSVSESFLTGDNTETLLLAGLHCLKQFMPADRLHLALYDRESDQFRLVFMATRDGARQTNRVLPFNKSEREKLLAMQGSNARYIGRNSHPAHRAITRHDSQWKDYCGIVLEIEYKDVKGSAVVLAGGEKQHTDEHLQLFTTLRKPLAKLLFDSVREKKLKELEMLLLAPSNTSVQKKERVTPNDIIGSRSGLKNVIKMVRQVSSFDSPVILLGETGVGKEMIANLIHQLSERREGPFVPVNCGAIPETLMDSELFGHEKGAFTGAVAHKKGLFELAHKGTVFLDEIGEMPLNAQIRMLRVLQEKKVQRIGSPVAVDVDIRVIAATHRNLDEMISLGKFRSDLWFRLQVLTIMIPPLRERKEDIPLFVEHFLEKKSKQMNTPAPFAAHAEALRPLLNYDWPGNVREFENVVERALILSRGKPLAFHRIVRGEDSAVPSQAAFASGENLNLDHVMAAHIRKVLTLSNGKINGPGGAAEKLGINPATLRNRMNKLGIAYGRGVY